MPTRHCHAAHALGALFWGEGLKLPDRGGRGDLSADDQSAPDFRLGWFLHVIRIVTECGRERKVYFEVATARLHNGVAFPWLQRFTGNQRLTGLR